MWTTLRPGCSPRGPPGTRREPGIGVAGGGGLIDWEDPAMWKSMLKTAAATAAFGLVHSALASHAAKRAATHLLGPRARNGLYRPLYIAQSVATTAALAAY